MVGKASNWTSTLTRNIILMAMFVILVDSQNWKPLNIGQRDLPAPCLDKIIEVCIRCPEELIAVQADQLSELCCDPSSRLTLKCLKTNPHVPTINPACIRKQDNGTNGKMSVTLGDIPPSTSPVSSSAAAAAAVGARFPWFCSGHSLLAMIMPLGTS
ncbi:hypothetical protein C0Q70_17967 [Pomacea canaliculata]|uniref:Uncharacterized protein n=1 Tax=Pomacea canaliculata TaxID=400727 RepID=A0A2T7NLW9_POMCA|nr:hypothetical protein C0Q70_17967 [Pomacea canaliculata]